MEVNTCTSPNGALASACFKPTVAGQFNGRLVQITNTLEPRTVDFPFNTYATSISINSVYGKICLTEAPDIARINNWKQ